MRWMNLNGIGYDTQTQFFGKVLMNQFLCLSQPSGGRRAISQIVLAKRLSQHFENQSFNYQLKSARLSAKLTVDAPHNQGQGSIFYVSGSIKKIGERANII